MSQATQTTPGVTLSQWKASDVQPAQTSRTLTSGTTQASPAVDPDTAPGAQPARIAMLAMPCHPQHGPALRAQQRQQDMPNQASPGHQFKLVWGKTGLLLPLLAMAPPATHPPKYPAGGQSRPGSALLQPSHFVSDPHVLHSSSQPVAAAPPPPSKPEDLLERLSHLAAYVPPPPQLGLLRANAVAAGRKQGLHRLARTTHRQPDMELTMHHQQPELEASFAVTVSSPGQQQRQQQQQLDSHTPALQASASQHSWRTEPHHVDAAQELRELFQSEQLNMNSYPGLERPVAQHSLAALHTQAQADLDTCPGLERPIAEHSLAAVHTPSAQQQQQLTDSNALHEHPQGSLTEEPPAQQGLQSVQLDLPLSPAVHGNALEGSVMKQAAATDAHSLEQHQKELAVNVTLPKQALHSSLDKGTATQQELQSPGKIKAVRAKPTSQQQTNNVTEGEHAGHSGLDEHTSKPCTDPSGASSAAPSSGDQRRPQPFTELSGLASGNCTSPGQHIPEPDVDFFKLASGQRLSAGEQLKAEELQQRRKAARALKKASACVALNQLPRIARQASCLAHAQTC